MDEINGVSVDLDKSDKESVEFSGEWAEATASVIDMARQLVEKYHPDLWEARIVFLFRRDAPVRNGRQTLGQASKIPDRMKVKLDYDFMIWVAKNIWDRATTEQRYALLDHELCHCGWGDSGWKMIPHQIEEFVPVIKRWGFWTNDLLLVQEIASKQPRLPGFAGKGKIETVDVENTELLNALDH